MKVKPTLFIALGGTGAEIALRLRRRILAHKWGGDATPVHLERIDEFPLAQFIYYDLDAGRNNSYLLNPKELRCQFSHSEELLRHLDLSKYLQSEEEYAKYPLIAEWLPLSPKMVRELGLGLTRWFPSRLLSRLYFFDNYRHLKDMIRDKLDSLLFGVSSRSATDRLDLISDPGSLRVVVIASTAGGTGSGSFLDMGYLAKQLSKRAAMGSSVVDLMLLLPGGYCGHAKARCEANTYAALMELEACMGAGPSFVRGWNSDMCDELPVRPYDNIFLLDTANLARKETARVTDIFDMVADTLFEDFFSSEFSSRKRSVSVNQCQHTMMPFTVPVDASKYGDMKMNYSKAYSSCGMAVIGTGMERLRYEIAREHAGEMLKVFFGVAQETGEGRESMAPTPDDARNLLKKHVYCDTDTIRISYQFCGDAALYKEGNEIRTLKLVDQLLIDGDKPILGDLHNPIDKTLDEIIASPAKEQRLLRFDELMSKLDSWDFDFAARVQAHRKALFQHLIGDDSGLVTALWAAVDNRENGGIEYSIQLVERIKEYIENGATGLLRDMEAAKKWFSGLTQKLRGEELLFLEDHYMQTQGGFFRSLKARHAEAKLRQMGEALRWFVEARLREIACGEAVILLKDLSSWLGERQDSAERTGRTRWSEDSFAGKLADYQNLVSDLVSGLSADTGRDRGNIESGNPMIHVVKASTAELEAARNMSPEMAMEMTKSVFDNLGGSRAILERLENEPFTVELVGQLRNLALSRLPVLGRGDENPLFRTLEEMPSEERRTLFQNCLEKAMPWVDANTEGLWSVNPIQYVCLVGVQGAQVFERKFGEEFRSALPVSSGITPHQIQFYESAEPGKLTCYVELSGMPFAALRQLPGWRASYDEESGNVPVHLHKDRSLFKHPLPPTSGELDRLAEHFSLFIQGIVFGVLTPQQSDGHFECLYYLSSEGQKLSIGNERLMRMQGVSPYHFPILQSQVSAFLKKAATPSHLAGLAALYDYYAEQVYPPRIMRDDRGMEYSQDSFARVLCRKLAYEARQSLEEKSPDAGDDLIVRLKDTMESWTEVIEGSGADVYQYEVGRAHVAKRRVKTEFSLTGWLEGPTDVEP